jgi:uncharacterized lipoprotein YehR (DUF1307 family)
MKKVFFSLFVALCALCLVACGGGEEEKNL